MEFMRYYSGVAEKERGPVGGWAAEDKGRGGGVACLFRKAGGETEGEYQQPCAVEK